MEVDISTVFIVGGNPDITVVKTVEESIADDVWRIVRTVRYRLLVWNQGNVDAINLAVLDPIDANLEQIQLTVIGALSLMVGLVERSRARGWSACDLELHWCLASRA